MGRYSYRERERERERETQRTTRSISPWKPSGLSGGRTDGCQITSLLVFLPFLNPDSLPRANRRHLHAPKAQRRQTGSTTATNISDWSIRLLLNVFVPGKVAESSLHGAESLPAIQTKFYLKSIFYCWKFCTVLFCGIIVVVRESWARQRPCNPALNVKLNWH